LANLLGPISKPTWKHAESPNPDSLQANLIMTEPCHFLNPALAPVAIIRPTSTRLNGAVAAIQGFVDDGLFIEQKNPAFLNTVFRLAEEADAARRRSNSLCLAVPGSKGSAATCASGRNLS
jgi:hypothetical protein